MANSEHTNFNAAPFSAQGSLVPIDDLWNPLATAALNGSTQYYTTSSETPLGASSGTVHTLRLWFTYTPSGSGFRVLASQYDTTGDHTWFLNVSGSNKLRINFRSGGASNAIYSEIVAGQLNWDNGAIHHGAFTINGASNCEMFIDGVEPTYDNQNVIAGTYTGPDSSPAALSIGATLDGVGPIAATVTRFKSVTGTAWDAAAALLDMNTEIAAQGEGFGGNKKLYPNGSLLPNDSLFPSGSLHASSSLIPS